MMAGAAEDVRALFGAGVRAALEAWPALQVSEAVAGSRLRMGQNRSWSGEARGWCKRQVPRPGAGLAAPVSMLSWLAWACVHRSLLRMASGACTARRRPSGWGVQWKITSSPMVSECEILSCLSGEEWRSLVLENPPFLLWNEW